MFQKNHLSKALILKQKVKIAAFAFILYWVMFGVYYTSGIAFSSFWQIWCKIAINLSLFLIALNLFLIADSRFEKFILLSATSFFAGILCFYVIALLLFNFFKLAINDYVGYAFIWLILASLISSSIIIYGRKKRN